jgi:polyisoprenoid-binding protein YceI
MTITENQTAVAAGTWQADVVHSTLGFEVEYMGIGTFRGTVADFDVSLADGVLEGAGRIASVQTKDPNLTAHLLSPEFFDAEQHPEVRFKGRVRGVGSDVEADGEITIKGITRMAVLHGRLTAPVADPYGNARFGLELETTVDRTEFGILWNAAMPDGTTALADDVILKATLSLVKAT